MFGIFFFQSLTCLFSITGKSNAFCIFKIFPSFLCAELLLDLKIKQNKTKQKRVHVSLFPLSYLPLDVLFSLMVFFWTIQKQVKKISHFSEFQSGF